MISRFPEDALILLLRQCYRSSGCQSRVSKLPKLKKVHAQQRRALATQSEKPAVLEPSSPHSRDHSDEVAIIGGGITGLSSAWYLANTPNAPNITIYEGSERLGGWLRTKHVNVGTGDIVFEQGPRTLRPSTTNGLLVLDMIKQLGIEDDMIITDKNSKAAQNRFVYYPDHLATMPHPSLGFFGNVYNIWKEPVFTDLLVSLFREIPQDRRPSHLEDESVGAFLSRRFANSSIPDNMVSAVLHGIYAGDIYQLSAKSLAPKLWYYEGQHESLILGAVADMQEPVIFVPDMSLREELLSQARGYARKSDISMASVYSFKRGIGHLADTLVKSLKQNPKVQIKTGQQIDHLAYDAASPAVEISTISEKSPTRFDSVISTISGKSLSALSSAPLPSLASTHAVTVMVVNLYYKNPELLSMHGFGYLIPRSIPYKQNPEFALGVVFDSCASIGQDSAQGTKLTVMLGGHWWDNFAAYPDEEEGARMAKAVLRRHLKIDVEPDFVHVGVQRECIPQYTVGHEARMESAHQELIQGFHGKLLVAGNSYTGVGLNDCVRAAKDVCDGWRDPSNSVTGLERFTTDQQKWMKQWRKTVRKQPSP